MINLTRFDNNLCNGAITSICKYKIWFWWSEIE